MEALGIDIGGSGIKGAVIDVKTGTFVSERIRIPTPSPAEKDSVLDVLGDLVKQLGWKQGPIGIGFPGVIQHGIIRTAANLDTSLIGLDLAQSVKNLAGVEEVSVINDADAAGVAEVRFGEGATVDDGTVLMITVGTGIGVALFTNHILVPNLELGHMEFKGTTAEDYMSERARVTEELSWETWGKRFNEFLEKINFLINPDLIILGGGGVKKKEAFIEFIDPKLPISFAHFGNKAGIIGAAVNAVRV